MTQAKTCGGHRGATRPAPRPGRAREAETALLLAARAGRISCGQAFRIAERLGCPPSVVGLAANRLGLKITGCRLGCFP